MECPFSSDPTRNFPKFEEATAAEGSPQSATVGDDGLLDMSIDTRAHVDPVPIDDAAPSAASEEGPDDEEEECRDFFARQEHMKKMGVMSPPVRRDAQSSLPTAAFGANGRRCV